MNAEAYTPELLQDWLFGCKHKWLLVLDNVDDARFLLNRPAASSRKPLREYLPHCKQGSILVTTRNMDAALRLVERTNVIDIEPMNETDAIALFEKKLGVSGSDNEVSELAAELEHMPLAIVQAAAYISQRAPRYSVSRYLRDYKKSERKRTNLLNFDDEQLRRDLEAKNSIIMSWQISFEHIQHIRPTAADLLSLMSFFDRQGIPEHLLRDRRRPDHSQSSSEVSDPKIETENATSETSDDDAFEDDIVTLRNFRFISDETGGNSFEMHALVQLATRRWLEANNGLERWKGQFIRNLKNAFPRGVYETWAVYGPLYPHAKAAFEQQPAGEETLIEWATLLYDAAWYAQSKGYLSEAEQLAVKAMEIRQALLRSDHEETWWATDLMGRLHLDLGRFRKAKELHAEVLKLAKIKFGKHHEHTVSSMHHLALAYYEQSRWEEAEKLQVEVLEAFGTKLGADYLDTLTSMSNLVSTYWKQSRWEEAEKLHIETLGARKTKLGADHPDTLHSMNNLALIYRCQDRWEEAEKLHIDALAARKVKLGESHPDTLTSMLNLAVTWRSLGRKTEAIALMRHCVQGRRRVLREGHPDLLGAIEWLEDWEAEDADEARESTNELEAQEHDSQVKEVEVEEKDVDEKALSSD